MEGPACAEIEVSIVVPALNEAGSLPALLSRIDAAMGSKRYEVLIVDDGSRDQTAEVCAELSQRYSVHPHLRRDPTDGLSGAVLHGLARARGEFLVVMDADLQHPPERIGDLLGPLIAGDADFVLGSRYVPGGSTDGRWGRLRQINSRFATLLARPFAGAARDPMSGFFALRRSTYCRAERLNPIGYKIALELICKCRVIRLREVPIHFGLRTAGESKLSLREQVRYFDHVSRLYDFRFPRISPRVKLLIATGCAWFVAFGLYVHLVIHDVNPVYAPALAFAAAAGATAAFHLRSLRARAKGPGLRDGFDLGLVLLGEWSICILAAHWAAYHVLHAGVLQVFVLAFGAAGIARCVLRKRLLRSVPAARLLASPAGS